MKSRGQTDKAADTSQETRPTIGLLTYGAREPLNHILWSGVADAARESDVDLLCFPGNPLNSSIGFQRQANILYELVGKENVDAVLIWSATLGHDVSLKEMGGFCRRFSPLPVVSIGLPVDEVVSVTVDNHRGMDDVVRHLIEQHSCEQIAFIGGPKNHWEAQERYRGYLAALNEYGLSPALDPKVDGDFKLSFGREIVHRLFEQPKVKFDALVAANDATAIGAMESLQKQGIRVPDDILVAGWDDSEESRCVTPPLTTAQSLLYEQGRQATEMVLALLAGEKVPQSRILSSKLLPRQSCGCLEPAVTQAAGATRAATESKVIADTWREHAIRDLMQRVRAQDAGLDRALFEQLLDALIDANGSGSPERFLKALSAALHETACAHGDVPSWQGALCALHLGMLSSPDGPEPEPWAEGLWHGARLMVSRAAQRDQAHQTVLGARQAEKLHEISATLSTTFDEAGLAETLAQGLPELGIGRGYLSLYEKPGTPSEGARMILAYDERGRMELVPDGPRFPSRQLVPKGTLDRGKRHSIVVEPLYFEDNQIGFMLCEADPRQERVYDTLRTQLSSALWGAHLVRQVKKAHEAARGVARVSIEEDLQITLYAIAQGIMDALGCDAVTLYPYDQDSNKLGPSPAMAGVRYPDEASRYREVEPNSIVYQVFDRDKLYVAEAAATDPFFRDRGFTQREGIRSFVGISLKVAERRVGVMFVNYRTRHHFTGEELDDIQLFAHQAAAAIRNARLLKETKTKAEYLRILYEAGKAVTGTLALDEILDRIAAQARRITRHRGNEAHLVHLGLKKGNELRCRVWGPPDPSVAKDELRVIDLNNSERIGIMGRAAITGTSQPVSDVIANPDYIAYDPTTRSELAVPIKVEEEVIGVINVEQPDFDAFDIDDQRCLESLATQAAIAIQNAQNYKELSQARGLVAGRTALAWMGMASSAWRHSADKWALTIKETAQLLRRDGERRSWFSEAPKASERLDTIEQLATQILDKPITPPLSSESGLKRVPISALVRERTTQLWGNAPYKAAELALDLQLSENATVRANPEWLRQAFDMLVDNAVKAIADREKREINIGTRLAVDGCEICISDTGPGIPPEIVAKIGLETIEKPADAEGLGMGLLIAQTIVQTYGGNISVGSTDPSGTTMVIQLPLDRV